MGSSIGLSVESLFHLAEVGFFDERRSPVIQSMVAAVLGADAAPVDNRGLATDEAQAFLSAIPEFCQLVNGEVHHVQSSQL